MPAIRPIKTKRLIIRDWKFADLDAIQRYAGDPVVCRYMIWGPNRLPVTRAFLKMKMDEIKRKPRTAFELAIVLRAAAETIGSVGLRRKGRETGEIGYVLARKHWGHGYTPEAVRTMLRWGFSQKELHRIYATCDQRNTASARVLEKCGMRREGAFRKNTFVKGRWRDEFLYAILKSEVRR